MLFGLFPLHSPFFRSLFSPGPLLSFQNSKGTQLYNRERPFLRSIPGKKPSEIVVYPTPYRLGITLSTLNPMQV
jgi:hypothetical protein